MAGSGDAGVSDEGREVDGEEEAKGNMLDTKTRSDQSSGDRGE